MVKTLSWVQDQKSDSVKGAGEGAGGAGTQSVKVAGTWPGRVAINKVKGLLICCGFWGQESELVKGADEKGVSAALLRDLTDEGVDEEGSTLFYLGTGPARRTGLMRGQRGAREGPERGRGGAGEVPTFGSGFT